MMGPRKRCCVTRTAAFTPTPISAIFWGQLRSVVHQAGGLTTANLQPFTTLPLDIQVGADSTSGHQTSSQHFFSTKSDICDYLSCSALYDTADSSVESYHFISNVFCVHVLIKALISVKQGGGCERCP